MNRPDCPQEMFVKILEELPPLEYHEYGTTSLAYEGLYGVKQIFAGKFYKRKMSEIYQLSEFSQFALLPIRK